MKNKILLLLALAFCVNSSFAQRGFTETDKLATTAKIWGFLKYYHPQVANGNYNWDDQLFEILPKIKNAKNKNQLSKVYLDWILSLGKIKKCEKCNIKSNNDYFDKNFDLSWIKDSTLFNSQIIQQLEYIEKNRHQGKKENISKDYESGSYTFTNELIYKDFDWNNKDLRLLTLFRYWNQIEYFFPYKYQIDKNWDEVLYQMIEKFLNPKSELDFHLAMLELVVSIEDSHGFLRTEFTKEYFGLKFIPAKILIIDNKAIINGFYNDSLAKVDDLKIGDAITKVNDSTISSIFKQKEKFVQGSNQNVKKGFFTHYSIFNGATDNVKIEFLRNDSLKTKTINRYFFKDFNYKWQGGEKYKILNENIGYINMGEIKINDVPGIMNNLSTTKAIIFDIRNYPQGTLYAIANYISSQKRHFYKVIYPDLDYPGRYIWRDGTQCGENGNLKYKGKVILLVDEFTQSHAEFTAMCLQKGDNVITIGSQTSGADGNVIGFDMVGGFNTGISGLGIFYPDGSETQRVGVKINIEVKPTIDGIKNGRDELVEKAIEIINGQ